MERITVPARRPWAEVVRYARAVRVGNLVEVSGTVAAGPDGQVLAVGDPYGQTRECLRIIGEALEEAGCSVADVVRTRVFLKDVAIWQEVGRAHGEVFHSNLPATSFIGAAGFIDPEILVEIEATAFVA